MTLIEKIIVLRKVGERVILPTTENIDVETTQNVPSKPFFMCSIIACNGDSGILELRILPQNVGQEEFQYATGKYSDLLLSLKIKKVIFHETQPKRNQLSVSPAFSPEEALQNLENLHRTQHLPTPYASQSRPAEIIQIDLDIPIAIKDLKFLDGKVSFEHCIKQIMRNVSFEIHNGYLKKEFDSIKNYFSKVFDTKKLTINIRIEIDGARIISHKASSPQIAQIDESLFELVEDLYIQNSIVNSSDDEIYSVTERASKSAKEIGSENLANASWLLNKLINKEKTKHYYHLRYLSSKHLSGLFNLQITGKPLSFIFLLQSSNNYYLIWETYSTQEATYIWRFGMQEKNQLQTQVQEKLELIKRLRKNNKMSYLKSKPLEFARIEHEYSGEDLGFDKWKSQLEEFIQESKA